MPLYEPCCKVCGDPTKNSCDVCHAPICDDNAECRVLINDGDIAGTKLRWAHLECHECAAATQANKQIAKRLVEEAIRA